MLDIFLVFTFATKWNQNIRLNSSNSVAITINLDLKIFI